MKAINTTIHLATGQTLTLKSAYEKYLLQQKELFSTIANHSVDLMSTDKSQNGKTITLWKKLQQTKNKSFLTQKERLQLNKFSQRFFSEEFAFEPLTIIAIEF